MCVCSPPCTPFEGDWPTETCPNPDCTDAKPVKPVGLHDLSTCVGLTFHCRSCPCRWYSVYTIVNPA